MPGVLRIDLKEIVGQVPEGSKVAIEAWDSLREKVIPTLVGPTGTLFVSPARKDIPATGPLDVSLPASDDAGLNPGNHAYRVRFLLPGQQLPPAIVEVLAAQTVNVSTGVEPDPQAPSYAQRLTEAAEYAAIAQGVAAQLLGSFVAIDTDGTPYIATGDADAVPVLFDTDGTPYLGV